MTPLAISLLLLVPPQSATTRQQSQAPAIRSTTRLVQLSVVVQDKKGDPITNLTKNDFSILDEGKPQNVAIFSAATPAPSIPHPLLPANFFTNRFDLKGEDPGAVTVILFDALNTASEDQSYVRRQILRFLQSLKPQDHVAIYALTTQLIILHEFTQDSSALVNAVNHFTPKEIAIFDASRPGFLDVPALHNDAAWMRFQERINQANAGIADQAKVDRAITTSAAIEAIAGHVASIPGRKSLIWVSGSYPLQLFSNVIASDRQIGSQGPYAKNATRALSRVDMAIYPVDVTGVQTNAATDPRVAVELKTRVGDSASLGSCMDCIDEAPNRTSGSFERQSLRDSERLLADESGGQAFYGNNDIRAAIHRAFDDGRYAYTIGFYPDHGHWDGKFRNLKITVKPGNTRLRYRKGYFAFADRSDPEDRINADLQEAADSPIEATNLGLIVTAKPAEPRTARNIELHIGLDPKQLQLQISQNHRTGAVDLFVIQRDASANILAAEKQHIPVNLEEKQFEYLSKAAMVLDKHLTVDPRSTEIRVVLRDATSGTLGSVTIPTKAIPSASL